MQLQPKGNNDQGDTENPSGQEEPRHEKASNWKKRTELPQVLSDGQAEEPKSGNRDKTWKPRDYIKSTLLFQCNGNISSCIFVSAST